MHPGFMWWHARRHACGGEVCASSPEGGGRGEGRPGFRWAGRHGGHGPGGHGHDGDGPAEAGDFGGGPFGVRRPLRFLAFKLEMSEEQVAQLARILDDLKTERAQAAVDHRRTTSSLADAIAADTFDAGKAAEAAKARVDSAERLKVAVVRALGELHALLDSEQRKKLSYLLRTGVLAM